ncbi:MAG: hypothetical protein N4A50_06060 [Vallitalea sp.]|jgi:hypothetical protein|nr:hypothetical protein [Vallitalea sp.]
MKKKKYYFIFTIFLLVCIIYSVRVSFNLHKLKESYKNEQEMVASDHILSFNLIDELDGNDILEKDYPQIKIQEIIDALKLADISNIHLFQSDSIFISNFYRDYIYILEGFKNEYIKTGNVKDENRFIDVIKDLYIIKNWLEDRYHDDNFNPYTYRELKEQLYDRLKYANFE